MGGLQLGGMTFGSLFKKPETILYPVVEKPAPAALRGRVECDLSDCIYCGLCAKCCPVGAIEVQRDEQVWSIDYYSCVQCSNCVESCPKGSLSMSTARPAVAKEKTKHCVKGE